jgi:Transposase
MPSRLQADGHRRSVAGVRADATESLAAYYEQLPDAQKSALQAVAMDMWEPYIGATREGLPNGDTKIVFDRFHIMREMTRAVEAILQTSRPRSISTTEAWTHTHAEPGWFIKSKIIRDGGGLKLGWRGTSASSRNCSTSSKGCRTDASGRASRLARGRLARADGEQKSNDQRWKARRVTVRAGGRESLALQSAVQV